MCKDLPLSKISKACILYHHERADGTGYPKGLNLGQIPEGVNVITLADVYDAITSERPYAKKQTPYEALDTIVNHMKNFFDPKWLKFFIQMLHNIEAVEPIKSKEIDKDKYNIDKHIEW